MAIAASNSPATSEASIDENPAAPPIEVPNPPCVLQSGRSPAGSCLFRLRGECVWLGERLALHS